ncbi:MAG TPA: GNAT family N-acetyltransferase [Novosphingobium sp.]|nr:GNAT family N-acetyltransferase [Novosphingobium sp.]
MATKAQVKIPAHPGKDTDLRAGGGRLTCVPWRALQQDIAGWDALARCASEPNPFFESWYLLPSLEAFDADVSGGERVSILRFEQDGVLRGLLPIVRQSRYYRWPIPNMSSWLHANCFLGVPLVAKGAEVPFWRAVLGWADRHPGSALFLHLRDIPVGGPLHLALQGVAAMEGRTMAVVHREDRAMLCSDRLPDAYLEASMSGKKRKELRRQYNRLRDEGAVAFIRQTDETDLIQWIDQFLRLEAGGWKGRAGSALAANPATARVFRESLIGAARAGKLERLTLALDGRPIAMLATFLASPGAFSFKTAFDEDYARFSPGVLLQRENLAMLQRANIKWCDSCAAADHPMIDHIWRERRAIGRISVAIGGSVRRAAFRQLAKMELRRLS